MQILDIVKRLIYDNPFITANQVFDKALNCLSEVYLYKEETLRCFPSFSSCKSIIYRLKQEFYPSSARLLSEHVRPELFNLQNNTNIFMHYEFETNSMLILGEINFISRFASQRIFRIYMDGTFKSCPNELYQIYTIHGDFNGQCFPIMYCFREGKTRDTYEKLFRKIIDLLRRFSIEFDLDFILIDFEYAAFNAIREIFPNS
ncbi:hypothetical protein DMUE_3669 [Dictyocoela muelleri]|nr:hypothetical protein DMUE_3669 [Dictyocoela muelleri]